MIGHVSNGVKSSVRAPPAGYVAQSNQTFFFAWPALEEGVWRFTRVDGQKSGVVHTRLELGLSFGSAHFPV